MDRFRDDLDYYCGEIVRQIYHEVNGLAHNILVFIAYAIAYAQKPGLNANVSSSARGLIL